MNNFITIDDQENLSWSFTETERYDAVSDRIEQDIAGLARERRGLARSRRNVGIAMALYSASLICLPVSIVNAVSPKPVPERVMFQPQTLAPTGVSYIVALASRLIAMQNQAPRSSATALANS